MASLITNIKLKYDTLANWTREDMEGKGAFLVLQRGEVGFCEVPSNIEGVLPTILFKVGDGNSTFGELNWVSALASDVRPWAKAENKPEYSAAEINGLSEYITQAVKDTNTEYRFNKVNDYEYEFQSKEIGGTEWNVDFTLTIPKYDGTPAFKPTGNSYLTFSSPSSFTLKVDDTTKHWNGTLEYFSSDKVWTTWDGTTTLSSVDNDGEHVLYLRGTGNTVITGGGSNYKWVLTGSDILVAIPLWRSIVIIACSEIAPVSPRLLLFLLLRWRCIAIATCSTVANLSPEHLPYLRLGWRGMIIGRCSMVVPVSPKHLLFLRLGWRCIAMQKCSTVALASLKLLLYLRLRWRVAVINRCSKNVPVSLRHLPYLLLRWRSIAITACSNFATVSNSRLPRLVNIFRSIVFLLLEQVRLRLALLIICSPAQVAPSLEHQKSIRPII